MLSQKNKSISRSKRQKLLKPYFRYGDKQKNGIIGGFSIFPYKN